MMLGMQWHQTILKTDHAVYFTYPYCRPWMRNARRMHPPIQHHQAETLRSADSTTHLNLNREISSAYLYSCFIVAWYLMWCWSKHMLNISLLRFSAQGRNGRKTKGGVLKREGVHSGDRSLWPVPLLYMTRYAGIGRRFDLLNATCGRRVDWAVEAEEISGP